jgi:hypothetical protein
MDDQTRVLQIASDVSRLIRDENATSLSPLPDGFFPFVVRLRYDVRERRFPAADRIL